MAATHQQNQTVKLRLAQVVHSVLQADWPPPWSRTPAVAVILQLPSQSVCVRVISKLKKFMCATEIVLSDGKFDLIIPASNPVFKWILQFGSIQVAGNPMCNNFKLFKLLQQLMDLLPKVLVGPLSCRPRLKNEGEAIGHKLWISPQMHVDAKMNLQFNGTQGNQQFCSITRLAEP